MARVEARNAEIQAHNADLTDQLLTAAETIAQQAAELQNLQKLRNQFECAVVDTLMLCTRNCIALQHELDKQRFQSIAEAAHSIVGRHLQIDPAPSPGTKQRRTGSNPPSPNPAASHPGTPGEPAGDVGVGGSETTATVSRLQLLLKHHSREPDLPSSLALALDSIFVQLDRREVQMLSTEQLLSGWRLAVKDHTTAELEMRLEGAQLLVDRLKIELSELLEENKALEGELTNSDEHIEQLGQQIVSLEAELSKAQTASVVEKDCCAKVRDELIVEASQYVEGSSGTHSWELPTKVAAACNLAAERVRRAEESIIGLQHSLRSVMEQVQSTNPDLALQILSTTQISVHVDQATVHSEAYVQEMQLHIADMESQLARATAAFQVQYQELNEENMHLIEENTVLEGDLTRFETEREQLVQDLQALEKDRDDYYERWREFQVTSKASH